MKARRFRTAAVCFCAGLSVFLLGCSQMGGAKRRLTVLVRMMPAQQRFFVEELVDDFERTHSCKVNLVTFENERDIERFLILEKGKKRPEIGLVKTPYEVTRSLVTQGLMKPLDRVVDSAVLMHDCAEYHPLAFGLGTIEGTVYYLPRKLETRILFYRPSKVTDALAKFDAHRKRIARELKSQNGFGLPDGYALEKEPSKWDFYDLYVVGSIWANEEYNGAKIGRIAHRGAPYLGTALFLVDRCFQFGATDEEVMKLADPNVARMLQWERVFVRNGLYNPGIWQDPWMGSNIYNGIKDGKVFLAYVQQIDCFLIHGWEDDPGMPTYLPEPGDMGLATVPKAVAFDLNRYGKPTMEGTRKISTGGWWWGIPETAPDPELSYAFARYITSMKVQAKECSKFGMIPVRKDILLKIPEVFDQGWVGDIFSTSIEQMKINELTTVSLIERYTKVAQHLVDVWEKTAIEPDAKGKTDISLKTIERRLREEFAPRQRQILGKDYPR